MIPGKCSLVSACRDYFNDRKIEIPEFKALTFQDKVELREMLIGVGYDIDELVSPPSQET